MKNQKSENDLSKVLKTMDKVYSSGDVSWFDYLTDDVVVYSQNSAEPYHGKKSYQKYFQPALTASKRKLKIISRDIRSVGENSIVSQTVQVIQDNVVVNIKQSQVWTMTSKGWKINHFHSAFAGNPHPTDSLSRGLRSISVINEKIATIASVVGVAQ